MTTLARQLHAPLHETIHRMKLAPIARGSLLAVAAAVLFGVSTPIITYLGRGVGAFVTATLLYGGATIGAGLPMKNAAPVIRRPQLVRLGIVAVLGAVLAPASLAWGLQHTGALSASLLLNLEAVFTVFLARAIYREAIGNRVAVAVGLMAAGGALLAFRTSTAGAASTLGIAAILAAGLGWALDNTLTRPLADFDPRAVVFGKALLGAALSGAIAWALGERWPSLVNGLGLLACGAAGYGVSLRLYLGAQRVLGAARTGSLFAVAPFVGATLAFALGDRENALLVGFASLLFGIAVYLHVTEAHTHRHQHEVLEHEHAHRHDDADHDHAHDPPVHGEHSHGHRHEPVEHEHEHGADLHHRHGHD